jgi:hypothetical protein
MPVGYHHKNTINGCTCYYNENNQYHRTDGPAIEWASGDKEWYVNGKRHRTDGPAIEWSSGTKEWWVDGFYLTEDQFNLRYPPKTAELPKVKSKYKF